MSNEPRAQGIASPPSTTQHFRNFALNVGEGVFLRSSFTLTSSETVLLALMRDLGAGQLLLGVTSGLTVSLWTLPQGPAAIWGGSRPRYRMLLSTTRSVAGLLWLALAVYLATSRPDWSKLSIVVALVAVSLTRLTGGAVVPLWVEFVNRLVRPSYRGRFYGFRTMFGAVAAFGSSAVVGLLLARLRFPFGYAWCLGIAGALLVLGAVMMGCSVEPQWDARPKRRRLLDLKPLMMLLWRDRTFGWFTLAIVLSAFGGGTMLSSMPYPCYFNRAFTAFPTVRQHPGAYMGYMQGAITLGLVVGGLAAAWVVDRRSARAGFFTALVLGTFPPVVALLAPNERWYLLTFVIYGAATGVADASYHNVIVSMAPVEKRALYVGAVNTFRAGFFFAAPVIGGALAVRTSPQVVFVAAGAISVLTAVVYLRTLGLKRAAVEQDVTAE